MSKDPKDPPGEAAPEVLEDRIWVDGCWDFFHHGMSDTTRLSEYVGSLWKDMLAQCFKLVSWGKNFWLAFIPTKPS